MPQYLKINFINLKILQSIIFIKKIFLKLLKNNHNKQIQHNKLSHHHKRHKKYQSRCLRIRILLFDKNKIKKYTLMQSNMTKYQSSPVAQPNNSTNALEKFSKFFYSPIT